MQLVEKKLFAENCDHQMASDALSNCFNGGLRPQAEWKKPSTFVVLGYRSVPHGWALKHAISLVSRDLRSTEMPPEPSFAVGPKSCHFVEGSWAFPRSGLDTHLNGVTCHPIVKDRVRVESICADANSAAGNRRANLRRTVVATARLLRDLGVCAATRPNDD